MTRVLSELLGAEEPQFRLGLKQLEQAAGLPSEDIRLSSEVQHRMQDKLRELSLDPQDTTGRELYAALLQHVKDDNKALSELLGAGIDEHNLMPRIERLVRSLQIPKQVFALKATVARKLLRKTPPKKVMKQLGYRSLESMLKHETVVALFAAAHMAESAQWHRSILTAYKKLLPSDFEVRDVTICSPDSDRWTKISQDYIEKNHQNIVSFRELGAVILLPLSADQVEGAPLATTLLTLRAINDIRVTSAYLKLHQVRPDFGAIVADIARAEPQTKAEVAGNLLPWKLVHRYFAHHKEAYNPDIFAPHVQPEDLQWHSAEDLLADLHPRFEFWQNAAHLGHLHQGETVSLNFLDAVMNFCNKLPYEQRIVSYLRDHLWHELMLRYLQQSSLEQTVHEQLSDELVDQSTLV
jgi:hypothetical protein